MTSVDYREPLLTRAAWSAYVAARAPLEGRFPFRSERTIERVQRRRVRRQVEHAYQHVPYYRETMDRLGIRPTELRTVADLARLPLIEREQLQRDPEYFVSRARPIESYLRLRTGGSSGEPVTVFHDPFSLFQGACHRERCRVIAMKLAGRRLRLRQVTIESPLGSRRESSRAFRSRSLIPPSLRAMETRLSLLDTPARNIERINETRPDAVWSYGSYLEALFVHLRESGKPFHRPAALLYGSDDVSEPARSLIGSFGIPILGAYGAAEAFHIGFECDRHLGLHLNADLYPVRIVVPDGGEVPDGGSGEVVVSNLVNRGTVLLNYRLGDVASKLPASCPCGRSLPLLSFLEGRIDDWLETPSGELLHPQAVRTLFTEERGILRYRIVQRSPLHFEAAVVAAGDSDRKGIRSRLEQRFADRLGSETTVEVAFVDSLPRSDSGKVRTVVSMRAGRTGAASAGEGDRRELRSFSS